MNECLSMADQVRRRVAAIQMDEIEAFARQAHAKGMNLAVSPIAMGEVVEGGQKVINIKTDLRMLTPGVIPPAGWTLYEPREDS
jgi:hypothetical protein